jgi:hypothetical protein
MDALLKRVTAELETFFEDENRAALDRACKLAKEHPLDIAALLDWVRDYHADRDAKSLATRSLRAALGLPVIPGPVCRTQP